MLGATQQVDGPSPALAGPGLAAAARRVFLATRPPFFVASVMPVLIGTAWAAFAFHRFSGPLFGLALAATVLAHAAANVYNDVGDDLIGADADNKGRIYPYTGGSRFIQSGLLTRAQMTRLALGLAAGALVIGVVLARARGPGVIVFGVAGLGQRPQDIVRVLQGGRHQLRRFIYSKTEHHSLVSGSVLVNTESDFR